MKGTDIEGNLMTIQKYANNLVMVAFALRDHGNDRAAEDAVMVCAEKINEEVNTIMNIIFA